MKITDLKLTKVDRELLTQLLTALSTLKLTVDEIEDLIARAYALGDTNGALRSAQMTVEMIDKVIGGTNVR